MNDQQQHHQHRFRKGNRLRPDLDRCSCGIYRTELLGPFHARQLRLDALRRVEEETEVGHRD